MYIVNILFYFVLIDQHSIFNHQYLIFKYIYQIYTLTHIKNVTFLFSSDTINMYKEKLKVVRKSANMNAGIVVEIKRNFRGKVLQ